MSTQQPHHQHAPHDHDHEHSHDHGHHHDHHDHEHDKKTGHDHHGHSHHGHGHGHSHAPKDFGKAFLIGIILNVGFVAIEAFYGVLINSLALLADASHNLSDVLGLLLAWGASVLVKKAPSARYTYGLRSTSILAALTNAVLLLVVTGGIAWEAIQRFSEPGNTHGTTMMTVAAIGIVINLATAFLFMSGQKEDLNVRAAFTHMLGDAAIAFGVVVAGVIILYTGWQWVDPAVSLLIAVLVVWGTWGLLHDSVNLTLHAVPDGINPIDVRNYLASIDGVESVHDLHIWGMSTTETALTAHLTMPKGLPGDQFYSDLTQHLKEKFGIDHPTVQVELKDTGLPCKLEPEGVV